MGSTGREQTLHCVEWLTDLLPLTVTSTRSTDPPYFAETPPDRAETPWVPFPSTLPPLTLALDPWPEARMPACVECRGRVRGVNGEGTDTAL